MLVQEVKISSLSELKIHFFYVTVILVSIIIALFTVGSVAQDRLSEYLSSAATITSVVLGVLAIIYAFISNDSFSKATGKLSEIVDSSKKASNNLVDVLGQVQDVANASGENSRSLTDLVGKITNEISELTKTTKSLETATNGIAGILPTIPSGLEEIKKRFDALPENGKSFSVVGDEIDGGGDENKEDLARNLISKSPMAGLLIMYACYVYKKIGKKIDFSKDIFEVGMWDYFIGFFVCMSAIGLVESEKVESEEWAYLIKWCPESLREAKVRLLEEIGGDGELWLKAVKSLDDLLLVSVK